MAQGMARRHRQVVLVTWEEAIRLLHEDVADNLDHLHDISKYSSGWKRSDDGTHDFKEFVITGERTVRCELYLLGRVLYYTY